MSVEETVMPRAAAPRTEAGALEIRSEIAPLRQVVVHTPGEEMRLVSPENKRELLFDDLLFAERAEEEHRVMCRLFEAFIGQPDGVLQLTDLLREAFEGEEARHEFVEVLAARMPEQNFAAYEAELKRLEPAELHRFALTGQSPLKVAANPLPNLLFTRDLSAVVGEHVILSHAATTARRRESVIIRTILRHHPRFAGLQERLIELPPHVSFEGGDLLVASDEVVLIGNSDRTSLGGVMAVTKALFERTAVRHVLVVNLPKERYCMHLDTVFTFASADECVMFPPLFEPDRGNVFHVTRSEEAGSFNLRHWPRLQPALEEVLGRPFTFIRCGGDDPINQRREQWTDGANLFALAPGVVVGYERNQLTYDEMRASGFHIVEAEAFLEYHAEGPLRVEGKLAILLRGHELSRGRGGPRCMTMPLVRETPAPANGTSEG